MIPLLPLLLLLPFLVISVLGFLSIRVKHLFPGRYLARIMACEPHRHASLSLLSALVPVTSALFDHATQHPSGTAHEVKRIQPWGNTYVSNGGPPPPFPLEAHRTKLNFRLPRGWPGGSQVENTRLKLLENYKRPELPRMRICKTWSILERRVAQNTQLNRKPCFAPLLLPSSHLFLCFKVSTPIPGSSPYHGNQIAPEIIGEQQLQMESSENEAEIETKKHGRFLQH